MEICRLCGSAGEHTPKCPTRWSAREEQLRNLEYAKEILTGDDAEALAELLEMYRKDGLSEKEIELTIACQKLRKDVHEQAEAEWQDRVEKNPLPTEEELSMGSFIEGIEPQVRDAVLAMRRKGYRTTSSGFHEFHFQSTNFAEPHFAALPEDIRTKLNDLGVEVKDDALSFASEEADLDAIKRTWYAIADLLPDLGHAAPQADHGTATSFREKFGPRSAANAPE
jgi:hypothetical protein